MVDVTRVPRQRLRLCADAGAGGADRVHPAPRRLSCGSAATPRRSAASTTCWRRAANISMPRRGAGAARQPVAAAGAARPRREGAVDERPAGRPGCRRQAAASQSWADRPDRRGLRRARRAPAAYRAGGRALPDHPDELVAELPELRQPGRASAARLRRPDGAAHGGGGLPHAPEFITPMAAVAGSVADEMLAAMLAGRQARQAPMSTMAATSRSISRRARRCTLAIAGTGHGFADRIVDPRRRPGARHRHQRLARPQLFAGHRRRGDRAGANAAPRPTRRRR